MQQMTPTQIFRKSEAAYMLSWVSGSIIILGIVGSVILSFFY